MGVRAAACGFVLLGGGCANTALNERVAIGTIPTPSFAGAGVDPERAAGMRAVSVRPRAAWDTVVDIAPIDGIVHNPTHRSRRPIGRKAKGRQVGAYPDPLAPPIEPCCDTLWGAMGELGRAGADALLIELRWVAGLTRREEAWTGWSPVQIWKRSPNRARRSGTVPSSPWHGQ